jgi:hypothetical protein
LWLSIFEAEVRHRDEQWILEEVCPATTDVEE